MNQYERDREEDYNQEARLHDQLDRQYLRVLSRHPDCRDPDHPGCDECDDDD